ncbi:MAG: PAS domain-containing protein [Actinobacteria bacterium]|nr:PAS domain-containing protein [Actinomycetota bacterium]
MDFELNHPKLSDHTWWMIFDSISDAISITSKEGNILFCNKAMVKLVGRPCIAIMDECCDTLLDQISHPIESCPRRLVLTSKKRETRVVKAGKICLNCIVDPILDENNEIVNLIHIISDLSDLKDRIS